MVKPKGILDIFRLLVLVKELQVSEICMKTEKELTRTLHTLHQAEISSDHIRSRYVCIHAPYRI
jgi:hypothetical protein